MRKFLIKVNGLQYEVEVDEIRDGSSVVPVMTGFTPARTFPTPGAAPAAHSFSSAQSAASGQSGSSSQFSGSASAAPQAAPAATSPSPSSPAAPVSAVPAGAHTITAPMPGTILKISVNIGEAVKKGQVLLVLEAMKMENEIVSPHDATVASINTAKGSSVNAGDILVSLS